MNNIKTSLRFYRKNKLSTGIILSSLIIAICSFAIIMTYIVHETGFDRFHEDSNKIYRVFRKVYYKGKVESTQPVTSFHLVDALKDLPEIEENVRILKSDKVTISSDNKNFIETNLSYADSNFFSLFSFPLISGNKEFVLRDPYTVVLSEKTAHKYFGDENPVGKEITINKSFNLTVTGVFKDFPNNTHLKDELLISFSTFTAEDETTNWSLNPVITYVKVADSDLPKIEKALPEILARYAPFYNTNDERHLKLSFQPISEIHLNPSLSDNILSSKLVRTLIIFGLIAFLTLLAGYLNLIVMLLANSVMRLKEIGITKVNGAMQKDIRNKFISESVYISIFSLIIASVIAVLLIPFISENLLIELSLDNSTRAQLFTSIFLFIVLTAIITSIYPSLVASRYTAVKLLSSEKRLAKMKFATVSVFVQFFITICLISSFTILGKQLNHISKVDTGYQKSNIIIADIPAHQIANVGLIKEALTHYPEIISISTSINHMAQGGANDGHFYAGDREFDAQFEVVDPDYCQTMGIKLLSGFGFSEISKNNESMCLVNETFVKSFEDDMLKESIFYYNRNFKIAGVVRDYNYESLHNKIKPLILFPSGDLNMFRYLEIKHSDNIQHVTELLNYQWNKIMKDAPLNYIYLDNMIDELYKPEFKLKKLLFIFSILAILLVSLGIMGIFASNINQRTKEIGIRKVNGAKIKDVLLLLNRNLLIVFILAFIVASPLTWYGINKWLQNFAYRTSVDWWIFALAGLISLGVAVSTVSFQSWMAASRNPVEALRYE